jgi:hypothetical protein
MWRPCKERPWFPSTGTPLNIPSLYGIKRSPRKSLLVCQFASVCRTSLLHFFFSYRPASKDFHLWESIVSCFRVQTHFPLTYSLLTTFLCAARSSTAFPCVGLARNDFLLRELVVNCLQWRSRRSDGFWRSYYRSVLWRLKVERSV